MTAELAASVVLPLRSARSIAGLTQAEVAERMGRSVAWVSRLERSSDPRISTAERYLRACGFALAITPAGDVDRAQ